MGDVWEVTYGSDAWESASYKIVVAYHDLEKLVIVT